MATSPLLSLPRELRDMITDNIITGSQPFRIHSNPQPHLVTRTQSGLDSSCKQFQSEYANLLRRAAFTPGNRTVAPVYNFDFRELTAFVQGLKSREIERANRNRNLIVNLFVLDVNDLDLEGLKRWVKIWEVTGCEVSYVVQWTAFDMGRMKGLESAVGMYREGRKILKVLTGRSVKCWNWEAYQEELRACR
ncbi:hypothetical protein CLAFUW4_03095 [Fulvia fulva]|uniref:Uncharacterized protein n=1 Tax=Passalora fulva TaxID=5499 RepID=A0A9Q8L9H7_PASFU|nr:uncharacterized protein CLAFUR5_03079 [Fulvia fulva]KAK4631842.1 hypothetical protein CLAFUR4_03088 [Fulvia fulva]KAK4632439.1 hypothetical protein CLAFUR0_03091 [Fulvia fulva]UJO13179.1 hypothetical protein CLAFUR5_03079 [Fulvia fulva]WPV11869.1 hypothetical protein CLAFUW4_03095 [Fulvia fulva]WPV26524.1 hypothetical protein CLAFUW7_03092 [Fulvia fulva]